MNTPGRNKLSIAILGPGAVGGFLAAVLSKNGFDVICIAKKSSVKALSEKGIKLDSPLFGSFTSMPKVVTRLEEKVDMLFITTKATTLRDALRSVDPIFVQNVLIIPLLNGIEHMDTIRSFYGRCVIAASIGSVELKRVAIDHIVHTNKSVAIKLASDKDIPRKRLEEIAQQLCGVGIATKVFDSEREVLWEKLVRLNALACTTSVTNQPIGFIRSDTKWRTKLEACVEEAARVALKDDVDINPKTVMAQIDALPDNMGTSMQRDIACGKPSELDAIAGAVIRIGAEYGIDCPTIKNLVAMIQSKGKSGDRNLY